MIAPTQTSQSIAQAPTPQVDLDRQRLIREAWKAYRGEFARPLKVVANQPDDNIIANFCVSIVDKGASWLFGQAVQIEATEETPTSESVKQDFINGFWGDDDDKMTLLSDVGINGGVCGQAFLKLIPPQGRMKYPRIVVMDPLLVRIVAAPDDCSLTLAYIIEYPGSDDWQKRQVIARVDPDGLASIAGEYDLDDTWTITNYMRRGMGGTQGEWVQVGKQEEWLYPFAPIFSCKNLPNPNETLGTSDLTPDLIDQNKSLNFLLSNLARIIRFHGHPKTWAKGINIEQINIGVDDLIVLASPDAQLGTLTPMENFAGILSVVANVMSNIDQQSRVPAVALGRQEQLPKLGNISGVALALMFQPLIEKTLLKRRLYGKLIREVTRAALVLCGLLAVEDYEDYQIDLRWQPLLPNDNLQAAQEALILQQIGVSMGTILSSLGLDAEDEANKKEAEDARKLLASSKDQGLPQSDQASPQLVSTEDQQKVSA